MTTIRVLCALCALMIAAPAAAQTSDAADTRAGSWFNDDRDIYLERTKDLDNADLDQWEAATKATIALKRDDLYAVMPTFDPLWNAKNRLIAGAVAKFAKRLEQLPVQAIEDWEMLTGADPAYAAASLVAENTLFPREKFSDKQFQSFKARFKPR